MGQAIDVAAASDPRLQRIQTIVAALDRYELTKRWLAEKLGTAHTNVNSWLDPLGSKPRRPEMYDEMIKIIETEGAKQRGYKVREQMERLIPVYATIMAGKPGSFDMDVEYEAFPVRDPSRPVWGRIVDGYSMTDILMPGDIAVFEERPFDPGAVCHLFNDQRDVVKAVKRIAEGHFQLLSFNEDYEPIEGDDWKIKGVCIGRIRYGSYRIRQVTEFPHGLTWAMRNERI